MHTFDLQVNAKPWTFNSSGKVRTDAGKDGKWKVVANEIVATVDGTDTTIGDVSWGFNKANQLTLAQGNKEVKAFDTRPDARPRLWINDNQLMVDPDGEIETSGTNFTFALKAKFGLDDAGDLIVTFDGTNKFTLDGFLADDDSRFLFTFHDKQLAFFPNELSFNGKWNKTGDDSEIRLRFHLTNPADEISDKPLVLPGKVEVDPKRNHLVFSYVKHGEEKKLEFRGTIEIRKDWKLVFKITSSSGAGVKSSTFELQTQFKWNATQTSLTLSIGKVSTATKQEITLRGKLLVRTVNGTKLQWDFAYNKSTSGGVVTTNLATSLEFVHKGGSLFIKYVKNGATTEVEVVAKLETVKYTFQGGIKVTNDPQGRSVSAFLGVSW